MTDYHISILKEQGAEESHDLLNATAVPEVPEDAQDWVLEDGHIFSGLDSLLVAETEPFEGLPDDDHQGEAGWYVMEITAEMVDGTIINIRYVKQFPVDPGDDLRMDRTAKIWKFRGKKKVGNGPRDTQNKEHSIKAANVLVYKVRKVV